GERGALEAGAAPNLLPGGRPLDDPQARAEVAAVWSVDELPSAAGRDTAGILSAAADGSLAALLIAGLDPADLPDPQLALTALDTAGFVVSLEMRRSAVTDRADVVFPVAPVAEKAGSFVNWEGRQRSFTAALSPTATPDMRVLAALADELCIDLELRDAATVRAEFNALGPWRGSSTPAPAVDAVPVAPATGQVSLATWRMLLDDGRLQDGEASLAATARPAVVRMSAGTAAQIGAVDDDAVTVSTDRGAITLPLRITEMPDQVAWVPMNSPGSHVYETLGPAAVVAIRRGGDPS
ncbi:MAG: molybdopterin dinucleotide binding domain-containing protein, partial [Mycobacterium sp.]